jgi:small-conductance mechanosensitive channel
MDAVLAHMAALTAYPLSLAGTVLVLGIVLTRVAFRHSPIGHFLCQLVSFAGFTAMLAVVKVSPVEPTPVMRLTVAYVTISFFKIIWWLAASWLFAGLVRAVLVFKRQPKETRFLQDLCAGVIYVGGVLGIVAYVLDMPISGLLAASGVVAIVLGLAMQSTLGDVFSGIVLNLAKPYRPGDWVILDGGLEGRVVETDWRGTQLLTLSADLATIPNSVISKAKLVNASQPTEAHGVFIKVRLPVERRDRAGDRDAELQPHSSRPTRLRHDPVARCGCPGVRRQRASISDRPRGGQFPRHGAWAG